MNKKQCLGCQTVKNPSFYSVVTDCYYINKYVWFTAIKSAVIDVNKLVIK